VGPKAAFHVHYLIVETSSPRIFFFAPAIIYAGKKCSPADEDEKCSPGGEMIDSNVPHSKTNLFSRRCSDTALKTFFLNHHQKGYIPESPPKRVYTSPLG
jgi:hypothetical protein